MPATLIVVATFPAFRGILLFIDPLIASTFRPSYPGDFVHLILLSLECLDSPTLHFTLCPSNARVGLTSSPCSVGRPWCSAVGAVSTTRLLFPPPARCTARKPAQLMRCVQRGLLSIFDFILLPPPRCLYRST